MDRKTKSAIKKTLKVIEKLSDDVIVYSENSEIEFDEMGNPIQNKIEKTVKMAILTPKHNSSFHKVWTGVFYRIKKRDIIFWMIIKILKYRKV